MRLVRNMTAGGVGKYSVIDNRTGRIIHSVAGSDDEFFVVMLKDQFAPPALRAYAEAALEFDREYAAEVADLADRAQHHHLRKLPD